MKAPQLLVLCLIVTTCLGTAHGFVRATTSHLPSSGIPVVSQTSRFPTTVTTLRLWQSRSTTTEAYTMDNDRQAHHHGPWSPTREEMETAMTRRPLEPGHSEFDPSWQKAAATVRFNQAPTKADTPVTNAPPQPCITNMDKAIRMARLSSRLYGFHAVETKKAWDKVAQMQLTKSPPRRRAMRGSADATNHHLSLALENNLVFLSSGKTQRRP